LSLSLPSPLVFSNRAVEPSPRQIHSLLLVEEDSAKYPKMPKVRIAAGLVVLLWLAYTALQTLFVMQHLSEALAAILGFIPGILGVSALLVAGLTPGDCHLRVAPLSRMGLAVLAAVFFFALAAILPFGVWTGWNWIAAFVYAPASGISQELFFRAALLPAIMVTFKNRPFLALVLHSALFGLWHIGPLFVGAPLWAVVAILFVPFLSGIGWGWQVQWDKTVVWAMVQHSFIWIIGSPFSFNT
jgi:membrane protease YdiL (CAAX protease family)